MTNRPQQQQPSRPPGGRLPAEKDNRDANEQSGSTGRNPGSGDEKHDGKDSGQDNYGMTGGTDRNAPQPGHESGSSGTSEYGRSDYSDDSGASQEPPASQFQKQGGADTPPRPLSKLRQKVKE